MRVYGNDDDDDGARVIHVYYGDNKGKEKSIDEHAQSQMYVFEKKQHIILFVLIETKKTKKKKTASSMTAW